MLGIEAAPNVLCQSVRTLPSDGPRENGLLQDSGDPSNDWRFLLERLYP